MEKHTTLHIVDGSSRSRAQQASLGLALGHHREIYSSIPELVSALPTEGIVLVRDDESMASANIVNDFADGGEWLPVVATSEDPRPRRVVEAIRAVPSIIFAFLYARIGSRRRWSEFSGKHKLIS